MVGFKPGVSAAARAEAHRAAGSTPIQSIAAQSGGLASLSDVSVAQVAPGTVPQALAAYQSRSDVAWAEPDYVRHTTLATNDPNFGSQYGPQKIGAPIAWDTTTGQPATKIAILDCGVYTESSTYKAPDGKTGHPDLRGKVVAETNFSDATTGADDWCGHGTLIASIAGANTNNGIGSPGIGFNVSLINGKVLNDNGEGLDSWVASGIVWATNSGAQVISMSLGGDGPCSQTLQSAINYAWQNGNGGRDRDRGGGRQRRE